MKVERVQRRVMPLGWLLKGIVYTILALAIAAIVYALVRFAMEQLKARKLAEADEKSQPLVDDAEALPFLAERPRGDLLGLARQHYEQGNYSEAIIYLFSYELVELDRGSRIQLAKGKTNRQYLRELKDAAPSARRLERTCMPSRACSSAAAVSIGPASKPAGTNCPSFKLNCEAPHDAAHRNCLVCCCWLHFPAADRSTSRTSTVASTCRARRAASMAPTFWPPCSKPPATTCTRAARLSPTR